MIVRGPSFLTVVWFGSFPLPPSPVSKLYLFLNLPVAQVELTDERKYYWNKYKRRLFIIGFKFRLSPLPSRLNKNIYILHFLLQWKFCEYWGKNRWIPCHIWWLKLFNILEQRRSGLNSWNKQKHIFPYYYNVRMNCPCIVLSLVFQREPLRTAILDTVETKN